MSWFFSKKEDESTHSEDDSISLQEIPRPSIKEQIEMPELPPLPSSEEEMSTPMHDHTVNVPPAPVNEYSQQPLPMHEENEEGNDFIEHSIYEDVMKTISATETAIGESEAIMQQLTLMRTETDSVLEDWRSSLEDAERKLLYADKVLFEK